MVFAAVSQSSQSILGVIDGSKYPKHFSNLGLHCVSKFCMRKSCTFNSENVNISFIALLSKSITF